LLNRLLVPLTAFLIAALSAIAAYRIIIGGTSAIIGGTSGRLNPSEIIVGSITGVDGIVETRTAGKTARAAAHAKQDLHNGEVIFTERASQVAITLRGGTALTVEPGSKFVAELDRNHEGVINGTLIEGDTSIVTVGQPGKFHLFKNGKELPLSEDSTRQIPVVPVVTSAAPQGPAVTSRETTVVTASTPNPNIESAPAATPQPVYNLAERTGVNPSGPLSDDEIKAALRNQTSFFQRCYLAYIGRGSSETAHETGIVKVSFTIAGTGKVKNAKLLRSDFSDKTLNGCILETVGRTSFRSFDGDEIPVLEFPIDLR
jgi:hypothetical protein